MLGKHLSEETRKKISESNNGENNPMFGKHHSADTRKKMSEALKGENNPMFGKHHSEETCKKISEARKGKLWWNDGISNKRSKECPGPEWKRGQFKKTRQA